MTPPEIRPASPTDLDALVSLTAELRRSMSALNPAAEVPADDHLRRLARGYIEGPYHFVALALDGGAPAGFIRVNVRAGEQLIPLPGRSLPWRDALRLRARAWRGLARPAPTALYVADVYVRPAMRRRGLGAALLEAARAGTAALSPRYTYLMVLADNPEGRAFWEKAGFRTESVTMVKR